MCMLLFLSERGVLKCKCAFGVGGSGIADCISKCEALAWAWSEGSLSVDCGFAFLAEPLGTSTGRAAASCLVQVFSLTKADFMKKIVIWGFLKKNPHWREGKGCSNFLDNLDHEGL